MGSVSGIDLNNLYRIGSTENKSGYASSNPQSGDTFADLLSKQQSAGADVQQEPTYYDKIKPNLGIPIGTSIEGIDPKQYAETAADAIDALGLDSDLKNATGGGTQSEKEEKDSKDKMDLNKDGTVSQAEKEIYYAMQSSPFNSNSNNENSPNRTIPNEFFYLKNKAAASSYKELGKQFVTNLSELLSSL